jgi:Raf kinase inhibitor-like YbhB/YbcL family protein
MAAAENLAQKLAGSRVRREPVMLNFWRALALAVPSLLLGVGGLLASVSLTGIACGQSRDSQSQGGETAVMKLTSAAFTEGTSIPAKYTGIGQDISPPLAWTNVPDGTKAFALICDDPDAPSRAKPRPEGPWVHWVIYNIPAGKAELSAGVPRKAELIDPAGARQGTNDFSSGSVGYRGPMPPKESGPHRYFFTIYALDQPLELDTKQADKKFLLAAMQGHILARGELMGTFERK